MNKTMNNLDIKGFREVLRQFERHLIVQGASCCNGVTLAQCHALLDIENSKKTTTGQIAANLGLDKSTLSRTIDNLVKLGLVERQANPDDRRYTLLSLTHSGKKICSMINSEANMFYSRVLDMLPQVKLEVLISNFELLVGAVGQTLMTLEDEAKC